MLHQIGIRAKILVVIIVIVHPIVTIYPLLYSPWFPPRPPWLSLNTIPLGTTRFHHCSSDHYSQPKSLFTAGKVTIHCVRVLWQWRTVHSGEDKYRRGCFFSTRLLLFISGKNPNIYLYIICKTAVRTSDFLKSWIWSLNFSEFKIKSLTFIKVIVLPWVT